MVFSDILSRVTIGLQRDDLVTSYPGMVNEALVEIQRRRSWLCMKKLDMFTILNGQSSVSLTNYVNLIPSNAIWTQYAEVSGGPNYLSPLDGFVVGQVYGYVAGSTLLTPDFPTSYPPPDLISEGLFTATQTTYKLISTVPVDNGSLVSQNGASLYSPSSDSARFKELTPSESPIHLQNSESVLTPCDVWTREKILRRQARLISNSILYAVYLSPFAARRIQLPVWVEWDAAQPVLNTLVQAASDLPFSVSYYGYLPDLVNPTDSNYFTTNYPELVVAKAKSIAFEAINDPAAVDFEKLFEARFVSAAGQDAYAAVAGIALRM